MRPNDREGWKLLVYRLVYPGVLGSMIFDLLDPLRPWTLTKVPLLAIAVTFTTDYLHMTRDLDAEQSEKAHPPVDALIAMLFCFTYFILAHSTGLAARGNNDPTCLVCTLSLALLTVTHLCVVLYEVRPAHVLAARDFARLLPFATCFVALLAASICSAVACECGALWAAVVGTVLSALAYAVYVLRLSPEATEA